MNTLSGTVSDGRTGGTTISGDQIAFTREPFKMEVTVQQAKQAIGVGAGTMICIGIPSAIRGSGD